MSFLKKLMTLCIMLCTMFSFNVQAFAVPKAADDTYEESIKVYFSDEQLECLNLDEDLSEESTMMYSRSGGRAKKWVVYDVKVTDDEWTDTSKKLTVSKSTGGVTVSASVSQNVSATYSVNVGCSKDAISTGVGYNVTKGFSISDSASWTIPSGYKVGKITAYPIYEVTSFKCKLVNSVGGYVHEKGSGKAKKPIGVEFKISWKK